MDRGRRRITGAEMCGIVTASDVCTRYTVREVGMSGLLGYAPFAAAALFIVGFVTIFVVNAYAGTILLATSIVAWICLGDGSMSARDADR